jgi:hypothetical protein
MVALLLQVFLFAIVVIVLAVGVFVQALYLREPVTEWGAIMGQLRSLDGRLVQLSRYGLFSEGLAISSEEIAGFIQGRNGLWAMYKNTGAFMDIYNYLEKVRPDSTALRRSLSRLSSEAAKARLMLAFALVAPPVKRGYLMERSARIYTYLQSQTAHTINDYCPALVADFRGHLTSGPGDRKANAHFV